MKTALIIALGALYLVIVNEVPILLLILCAVWCSVKLFMRMVGYGRAAS